MSWRQWLLRWMQYRYRFVPWLIWNLKDRSVRSVTEHGTDIVISENEFAVSIQTFLERLHQQKIIQEGNPIQITPHEMYRTGLEVMKEVYGFSVERCSSSLLSGGTGVRVTNGSIPHGCITSLYPGLIYETYEPIFFQSIKNPFIFRCADGRLIDGKDRGLSRSLYNPDLWIISYGQLSLDLTFPTPTESGWSKMSCRGRDSCWPLPVCDDSWLTPYPVCPLNIGQYVNNHTKQFPANVAYQEFTLPPDFSALLKQYLPNNHYSSSIHAPDGNHRCLKIVALVSLREIQYDEELFSSYFTIVR